jgi:hypothetical protein
VRRARVGRWGAGAAALVVVASLLAACSSARTGLRGVSPRLYGRLVNDVPKGKDVCVAAYTGHFTSSSVSKPLGRPAGTLAVAVVATPGNELLGTLILVKVPVRFQHMF